MTERDPNERPLEDTLQARRPAPARQFSDRLRAHLLEIDARERSPARLWTLVGAYAGSGALLLVLAAIAAAGGGL